VTEHAFTALFPFGGLGAGARGFLDAQVQLLGSTGSFRCLGGLDFDAGACADFAYLTGSESWCVDVLDVTADELRARYGAKAPDVVFMSPPCKGSSRLLSAEKAKTAKYQAMNRLAVEWTKRMLEAWPVPPALVLLENVPGLPTRAAGMLRELRSLLKAAGYVFHASTHDCGEIGGLAQHRTRYLLVARHPGRCPPLLYQPPKKRVRGVGEVLSTLPMPATVAAGAWGELHTMPRLSWRNWLRLALIPAGGDWRDLAGVLEGRARREVFRRHAIADWTQPIDAVTGPGGHSVEAVGDPRVTMPASDARHWSKLDVRAWTDPALTVIGKEGPANGGPSVADPRIADEAAWNRGAYGVKGWAEPSGTVTGGDHPSKGRFAVADPRGVQLREPGYDAAYGVLGWTDPARTVAGNSAAGCGAYAVADPRDRGFVDGVRFLTLDEAMALEIDAAKPPPFTPVIVAEDGTWHRPLTLLELAALQGIPSQVDGAPLRLTGTRTQIAEHVGNAVPVAAARAIAERMLVSLVEAHEGTFSLGSGDVWVVPNREAVRT
jgi:site-specific DNA-cytosine methylase